MSYVLTATPLKISLQTKDPIGVGRFEGLEIIPYTHFAHQKYGVPYDFMPKKQPSQVPELYTAGLRPYQVDDVNLLTNRVASANLSEPRTGKTPTALRTFKAKGLKKIIIIAPAASLYQWKDEVLKWYQENAEVLDPQLKPKTKHDLIYDQWGKSVTALIISYDSLKLVTRNGKITGLLSDILKQNNIDGIIVDEAHRIRNHKSLQAKAVFALNKIPNRHVLTGTPAHGHLQDVYSILHFLYPTIFTGYWRFINYYFKTYEQHNYGLGTTYTEIGDLNNKYELPEFIDRIAVQHKRKDVMEWLPDKDYQIIRLPLTEAQEKYLKELREDFETNHIIVENVLTQLIRERQIANDPKLVGLLGTSPKTDWLLTYLADNQDKSIIIFSSFTQYIKSLCLTLNTKNCIIGETSGKQRDILRKSFQAGEIKHLFINTQAGKEALTLDKAEVAIFLDIYPPYGDVDQAENRFTATTIDLKDKPHTIIQVMMKDCYDESLFTLVKERASETAIINNYRKHLERRKNV